MVCLEKPSKWLDFRRRFLKLSKTKYFLQIISTLYADVIGLQSQSEDASNLIRDEQIRKYITNYLTPLITQCLAFDSTTSQALKKGREALEKSLNARNLAETASQKILVLAANVDKIQAVQSPDLDSLNQSIIRVRSVYENASLKSSMQKLRTALAVQKVKHESLKTKREALRIRLNNYKLLYQSLSSLSC